MATSGPEGVWGNGKRINRLPRSQTTPEQKGRSRHFARSQTQKSVGRETYRPRRLRTGLRVWVGGKVYHCH